jgi:DNA-directed RNA polymerase specialized sigma24 family protein
MTRDAFARFRGGESAAAHEAVATHAGLAFLTAFGVLGDGAAAEAVAAETLLEGLRTPAPEAWREDNLAGWVVANARSRAIAVAQEAPGPVTPAPPPAVDADAARACLEAMPAGSRHLLSLAITTASSMDQVAHRTGLGLATARDAVREALLQLQSSSDGAAP